MGHYHTNADDGPPGKCDDNGTTPINEKCPLNGTKLAVDYTYSSGTKVGTHMDVGNNIRGLTRDNDSVGAGVGTHGYEF